ncbi:MAG: hypothetical protein U0Q22_10215 [Acidimicrobiales bacterium]
MLSTISTLAQFRAGGMHDGHPVVIGLLVLAIIALVVYGFVQLGKGAAGATPAAPAGPSPGPSAAAGSSARIILDERFARGEIDSATYLHQVETLRRADGWVPPVAPTAVTEPVTTVEANDVASGGASEGDATTEMDVVTDPTP